jgi:hypothetical protein
LARDNKKGLSRDKKDYHVTKKKLARDKEGLSSPDKKRRLSRDKKKIGT